MSASSVWQNPSGSAPSGEANPSAAERLGLLRLARTPGIGPMNFTRLLGLYGTGENALAALPQRLQRAGRKMPPIPTQMEMEDEIAALEKMGGRHLLRSDSDYPLWLTHVPDAPPLLFVRGRTDLLSTSSVGIVGARNASAAGIRLAGALAAELAAAGQCVISGLARGIDTAAHEGALHPGLTVAALAGGLDQPYPPENAALQEKIAHLGCLVTEAPLDTYPQSRHFPRRNRLIAGMSGATLVIEAAERSGTLITARLAAEYDRVVLAVPGTPLDPRSRGGNQLIKNGALLVESGADILEALCLHLPHRQPAPWQREASTPLFPFPPAQQAPLEATPPTPTDKGKRTPHFEQRGETSLMPEEERETAICPRDSVLELLSHTPIAVDEVVTRCQFSVSTVMTVLSELELEGLTVSLPGGLVALLPEPG